MEKGRRRGGRVRQSGPSRQKQYGKGHTERTEAVRLKLACVGVGQRRLRLNLADRNSPTKSGQQHHKPHHGRPKSRTKTIQNRSKMCRKSSPNRSGMLRLAKICPWTVFGTILWMSKVRPGPSKSGLGMPRGCQKHPENVSGCAKDVQKRVWRAPETRLETICLGERRPRRSWIDFRKFSRPNFSVFLERSWVDFRLCFAIVP